MLPKLFALSLLGLAATEAHAGQSVEEFNRWIQHNADEIRDLTQRCDALWDSLYIGMPETSFHYRQPNRVCAHVNATETAAGLHEQFVWGDNRITGRSRYVYFDNGVLTAIQR
jgi:hypothetical protein